MIKNSIVNGLHIRKGTQDSSMIKDALLTDYPYVDGKGHTVLDLGAHIGAFTKRVLDQGAKKVYAVEPWTPNRELLVKNFGNDKRVEILPIACSKQPHLELSIPGDNFTGAVSGYVNHRNPTRTEIVSTATLEQLIEQTSPTLIKMDIEGAEHEVLPCDLTGVQVICGELHTMSMKNRQSAFKLLAWLETQGFYITYLVSGPQREKMFQRILYFNFHAYRKSNKGESCTKYTR